MKLFKIGEVIDNMELDEVAIGYRPNELFLDENVINLKSNSYLYFNEKGRLVSSSGHKIVFYKQEKPNLYLILKKDVFEALKEFFLNQVGYWNV